MTKRLITAIDRRRRIRRVVRHIEARLDARPDMWPDLAELCDVASLSPFHFIRLYHHAVGESPQATIRRFKLTAARRRLAAHPALSVTKVAFDHGYESAQSFARAFRREFNAAPSARSPAPAGDETVTISLARMPRLSGRVMTVHQSWDGVADAFDEMIGLLDVAHVPRAGQDMCGFLSPDGRFDRACALDNASTRDVLRLSTEDRAGGWRLRMTGQTHAVWRRFRCDAALNRWRAPEGALIMRYLNDPAYVPREEERVALYIPLRDDAPAQALAHGAFGSNPTTAK